jgi:RPA family protein
MYISGVLTEVSESGGILRCRVADPTGVFDLVCGSRKAPVADILKKMTIPSFLTVTGFAQLYRKNGAVVLSVRPDNVQTISRGVRDKWVITTAEITICRLEMMHQALQGGCTDKRILAAVRHYSVTLAHIDELSAMIDSAIKSVRPRNDAIEASQVDIRKLVVEIIQANPGPRGIAVEEIIKEAALNGISQKTVLATIESLIVEDECYQPQKGFVRLL